MKWAGGQVLVRPVFVCLPAGRGKHAVRGYQGRHGEGAG